MLFFSGRSVVVGGQLLRCGTASKRTTTSSPEIQTGRRQGLGRVVHCYRASRYLHRFVLSCFKSGDPYVYRGYDGYIIIRRSTRRACVRAKGTGGGTLRLTNLAPRKRRLFRRLHGYQARLTTRGKIPPCVVYSSGALGSVYTGYPISSATVTTICKVNTRGVRDCNTHFARIVATFLGRRNKRATATGTFSNVAMSAAATTPTEGGGLPFCVTPRGLSRIRLASAYVLSRLAGQVGILYKRASQGGLATSFVGRLLIRGKCLRRAIRKRRGVGHIARGKETMKVQRRRERTGCKEGCCTLVRAQRDRRVVLRRLKGCLLRFAPTMWLSPTLYCAGAGQWEAKLFCRGGEGRSERPR